MHIEELVFDKVFNIERFVFKGSKQTSFGFLSSGRRVPHAFVDGHPEIPVGQKLLVVLMRKDKWRILGWRNLETGEVIVSEKTSAVLLVCLLAAFSTLILSVFFQNPPVAPAGRVLLAAVLCGVAVLAYFTAVEQRMIRRARKILLDGEALPHEA